jgi:ankyrin repeat protein
MQKLKILACMFIFLGCNKSVHSMQNLPLYEYFVKSSAYIQNLSSPYLQKSSELIKIAAQKSLDHAQKFLEQAIPLAKKSQEFCKTHQQLIGKTSLIFCGLYTSYAIIRSARMHRMVNTVQKRIALRLLHAGYISTLEWALAHGADINQTFEDGKTALHIAAEQGDVTRVSQLIAHNADLKRFNTLSRAEYPIHTAARTGHIAVIEQLVNTGNDINMALWAATASGQLETVKWTIQHGADLMKQASNGDTSLTIAQRYNQKEIENYLLRLQPAAQNDDLCTHFTLLLHNAITQKNLDLALLAINSDASLVHINESQSPLNRTIAASAETTPTQLDKIAQALVEAGVPLHTADEEGNTPLHRAVLVGNTRLAELFLRYGADVNSQNKQHSTALDIAFEKHNDDMQRLLEAHMNQYQVQTIRELMHELEQPDKIDESSNTLLHRAVQSGNIKVAALSLQHGFNPCLYNSSHLTPLDIALARGNLDMQILLAAHMPKDAVQDSYERFTRTQSAE